MRHGNIDVPMDKLEAVCKRWSITELSLFGSVLRDDFRPDSDVDVMVRFSKDSHISLLDIARIQDDLGEVFGGRRVDLSEREAIEKSPNYVFRHYALRQAEPVYVAG